MNVMDTKRAALPPLQQGELLGAPLQEFVTASSNRWGRHMGCEA